MDTLNTCLAEYKHQLLKGDIQKAYRGIMEYMKELKNTFSAKYPDYSVSGNLYQGYMDMSYFSFTPAWLTKKKLKIAVVFLHDKICFEIWLCGVNKNVQKKYWEFFKRNNSAGYKIPNDFKNSDSILESTLVENPDFDKREILTAIIERGVIDFSNNVISLMTKK